MAGNEWFTIESNKTGTRWTGKVWYIHNLLKYEFDLEFELPVTYPNVPPELALPELDGKTEKMYRGGKICLDTHFRPLWQRNQPHFGIAHAMALGVRPSHALPSGTARPSSHVTLRAFSDGTVVGRRDPRSRRQRTVQLPAPSPRLMTGRVLLTCQLLLSGRITHKDAKPDAE